MRRLNKLTLGAPSWFLLLVAGLCMLQGATKAFVLSFGARAPGTVVFQERAISTRGATWLRYEFQSPDGQRYSGTAMTSNPHATNSRMIVAYFPMAPQCNTPANGVYTTMLSTVWVVTGIALTGLAVLLKPRPS